MNSTGGALQANSPLPDRLRSCQCTQAQLQSDIFQAWAARVQEAPMHDAIEATVFDLKAVNPNPT